MSIDISRLSENNEMPEKIFLISSYMRNTSEKIKNILENSFLESVAKTLKQLLSL